MKKLTAWLQGIFPLLQNMFLPALLAMGAIIWFYAHDGISPAARMTLHHLFYLLSFASFLILLYFNQNKGIFFILCLVVAYTLLNRLKYTAPQTFSDTPEYLNLCAILPLNLTLFYFLPEQKLLNRRNVYLLLTFFVSYAIGERLSRSGIALTFENLPGFGSLSGFGLLAFISALLAFYGKTVAAGRIMDYSLFFAALLTAFGFYYAADSVAPVLFFCLAAVIIILGLGEEIYNDIYKDRLTGFASRNAFIIQSPKFPLKYSVGIVSIDNYDNLKKAFGRRGRKNLLQMISRRIVAAETEAVIYRYGDDELVLIFKNEDKNAAYEQMEQIRRAVASAEFMLSKSKKPVKLTISGSISEKKRSDANALEVLSRTRKALQKTSAFSFNVTSKA